MQFVYIVCQVDDYQNILKLSFRRFAFTSYKAPLQSRRKSGTSLPATLFAWFIEKLMIEFYKYLHGLSALIKKEVFTKRVFNAFVPNAPFLYPLFRLSC